MKKTFLVFSFLFSGVVFMNAQTTPTATSSATKTEIKPKNKKPVPAAAMYECPMKCEAVSKTAGKCAKCGMEKVKVGAK